MRKLSGLQWIIVLLTLATAVIHLWLGAQNWGTNPTMGAIFALNGVGYVVLLALLYFSGREGSGRSTIRWILILYTLLTIVLYFVFQGGNAFSNTIGLITKAIEALLVILLFLDRGSDKVEVPAVASASRAVTDAGVATRSAGVSLADSAAGAAAAAAATAGAAAAAAKEAMEDTGEALAEAGEEIGEGATRAAAGVYEAADDVVDDAAKMSREALLTFFGDIDSLSEDEWRGKLLEHLRILGDTTQFDQPIEYVEGIGEVFGGKLRGASVATALDLLVRGATRKGRNKLAKESDLAESQILTWTNQVDLYRIKGVAQEYADLLEQSGVDTVVELAQRKPENLHRRMLEINEDKKLVRRPPHLSEVEKWVEQARGLPRVMHY